MQPLEITPALLALKQSAEANLQARAEQRRRRQREAADEDWARLEAAVCRDLPAELLPFVALTRPDAWDGLASDFQAAVRVRGFRPVVTRFARGGAHWARQPWPGAALEHALGQGDALAWWRTRDGNGMEVLADGIGTALAFAAAAGGDDDIPF